MLLRGRCCEISTWKQKFSKAQVLWNEVGDTYSEIIETAQDREMRNVEAIWEQVCREWYDFERDARAEIKYLEQTMLNSGSVSSKALRRVSWLKVSNQGQVYFLQGQISVSYNRKKQP